MNLKQTFIKNFGDSDEAIRYFHAPARANIIGEHIDYNGGYVMPFALTIGTYAVIRKRPDNIARFASTNVNGVIQLPLNEITYNPQHDWANYPKGIVHFMQKDGHTLGGFDVLFSGNISGAGLSSSASLELATAVALNSAFSLGYDMISLVKLAQRAENQFCDVNCGIMDQFAIGMGKKGMAIHLHCDSLQYRYVPLSLGDYKFVIMDTNKKRKLNESKYNERRAECEQAAKLLNVEYLTKLNPQDFALQENKLDNTLQKRARHVIHENHRVNQAEEALKDGDISKLGELLTASHISLRDDYEVSCVELDTIVEEAIKHACCVGARMTGAGFGGCAIALVKETDIPDFINAVSDAYTNGIGYSPGMYVQESGEGAVEVNL
ncbi:MAG: galactokinase [Defluviitaleaceae bacterium]|nr:galactokinase [Defluviitaleaceae bacterium]